MEESPSGARCIICTTLHSDAGPNYAGVYVTRLTCKQAAPIFISRTSLCVCLSTITKMALQVWHYAVTALCLVECSSRIKAKLAIAPIRANADRNQKKCWCPATPGERSMSKPATKVTKISGV